MFFIFSFSSCPPLSSLPSLSFCTIFIFHNLLHYWPSHSPYPTLVNLVRERPLKSHNRFPCMHPNAMYFEQHLSLYVVTLYIFICIAPPLSLLLFHFPLCTDATFPIHTNPHRISTNQNTCNTIPLSPVVSVSLAAFTIRIHFDAYTHTHTTLFH